MDPVDEGVAAAIEGESSCSFPRGGQASGIIQKSQRLRRWFFIARKTG
jgi:hypothetical protein